jgi:hypothetical protein
MIMYEMMVPLIVAAVTAVSASIWEAPREVSSALQAVSSFSSYGWSAMIASNDGAPEIACDGKSEKDGFSALTVRFGDRTIEGYMLGNHAFVTSPDTKWKDIPEMKPGESPTIFMDRMLRALKLPAIEIAELTRRSTNLREANGVLTGDLDEEAAKELLQRPRGRAAKDESPSQAKGSLKVWTTNGLVSKYQYTLSGKQPRDGREVDLARTVTVEIKDVGTTTVIVPDRIKEKLKAKAQNQATAAPLE